MFMVRCKKATERDRTADLLITNQLLYQLSYGGGKCLLKDRASPTIFTDQGSI